MFLNVLIIVGVILIFLVAIMLIRTTRMMKSHIDVEPVELVAVDQERAALHLAQAIRIKTISQERGKINLKVFNQLHEMLENAYPLVHQQLKREVISDATLLFTWQGKQPELQPVLFAAHQDVVPADEGTLDAWNYPPFSGEIADGFIWGRGSLDIKSQMIAIFESIEMLLAEEYTPERTILLAFGQDEEVGGKQGAAKIVEQLEAKNIHLAAMLDEGGTIMNGTIPGVTMPVALVGNAEKGHISLKLSCEATPGHSAMPGKDMAIIRLARALIRLDNSPQPVSIRAFREMFKSLGTAASFGMQFVMANLWFFGPIARRQMEDNPQVNASIRTTTAFTMIHSGVKENVLPHSAEALVNMRLLPGDTIRIVCNRVRKIIKDDRVKFEVIEGANWEASPLSPTDTNAYKSLERTISQVFDGVAVAPYLVLGATDSRYYAPISDSVYRFSPFEMAPEDLNRMHGINERLSVEALKKMVQFFHHLITAWSNEEL
jgi:carboxypeptidase PM20D1